jgi:hypothetical protein
LALPDNTETEMRRTVHRGHVEYRDRQPGFVDDAPDEYHCDICSSDTHDATACDPLPRSAAPSLPVPVDETMLRRKVEALIAKAERHAWQEDEKWVGVRDLRAALDESPEVRPEVEQ